MFGKNPNKLQRHPDDAPRAHRKPFGDELLAKQRKRAGGSAMSRSPRLALNFYRMSIKGYHHE